MTETMPPIKRVKEKPVALVPPKVENQADKLNATLDMLLQQTYEILERNG